MDTQGVGWGTWIGLIWLRIRTGGGHLWMRKRTFGFHKMQGTSWLVESRLALKKDLAPWSK
jgi:hypothetical protein